MNWDKNSRKTIYVPLLRFFVYVGRARERDREREWARVWELRNVIYFNGHAWWCGISFNFRSFMYPITNYFSFVPKSFFLNWFFCTNTSSLKGLVRNDASIFFSCRREHLWRHRRRDVIDEKERCVSDDIKLRMM